MARRRRRNTLVPNVVTGIKYRSKFEMDIHRTNPELQYEPEKLEYVVPAKKRTYTYDFLTPNGTPVEAKGYFRPGDKEKLLLVQATGYDIHLLFMKPDPKMIAWANKHNFPYAVGITIPNTW